MMKQQTHSTHSWPLMKRLGKGYLLAHKKRLVVAILCMLIVAACTGLFAHLIQPLFDKVFIGRDLTMLFIIPALILAVTIIKGIATYIQSYLMEFIGQRMVADLQKDLYAHIIHQDLTFFQTYPTAGLTSRFIFDLQRLNQAVSKLIGGGVRDVTMAIGLTINLFAKDWQLAVVSIIILPLAALPVQRFGRLMRKYARLSQEKTGLLSEALGETLAHNRQVKSYTMEAHEIERIGSKINDVFYWTVKAARIRAAASPVLEMVATFAVIAVILFGGWRAYTGEMTTGAFLSFLTSLLLIVRPVKGITNLNNALQEGLAAAERAFTLLDATARVVTRAGAKRLKVKEGEIEFKNVSLTYGDGTDAVKNLNLTIPAGQTVALVGLSGAGKSTILNLIPRFFDPTDGEIFIDGNNIKDITLKSLRANIALVTQDVAIFDDTAFNNIAYGNPKATKKAVLAAAKSAAAHTFIEKMPNGYDTRLGEAGTKLSGGQKQRIAIARALVKDAPILLLDEATSSLDSASEKQVQKALETLLKGRTALVVAHRLSTVRHADCIHVLENGEIVESGNHDDLLNQGGAYARLFNLQQGRQQ